MKKILSLGICMLLFVTILSVTATQNTMEQSSVLTAPPTNHHVNNPMKTFTIGEKTCYGWAELSSPLPKGPIQFSLNNPGDATSIKSSATQPFAGTWIQDTWYCITYPTNDLITVDPTTGTETIIGNTGVSPSYTVTGLAYNDLTKKAYGAWAYTSGSWYTAFYEINLATGVATHIGTDIIDHGIIDIACNSSGVFFGPDILDENLYRIDPTIPSATLVGNTGLSLNFAQGAEVDKDTDILYLAAYDTTYGGGLYTCNTQTGVATFVGAFPGNEEVDCLAIPYTYAAIAIQNITGGLFKINAKIKNTGGTPVTNIQWNIKLDGGLILLGKNTSGTISTLVAETTETIQSKLIFGIGTTQITITATSTEAAKATEQATAKILLIFVKIQ